VRLSRRPIHPHRLLAQGRVGSVGHEGKKARTGIISRRYRLLVDQSTPSLYQLLHRVRQALALSPKKLEEEL
jgi:hypothetical protein